MQFPPFFPPLMTAAVLSGVAAAAAIEVRSVAAPPGLPLLPWVIAPDGADSPPLAPLGSVSAADGHRLAAIFGGWSAEYLLLTIEVEDDDHVPPENERVLWSADSVEIGLDLAGDGAGRLPSETSGPIGVDDFKLIFGLTAGRPAASVLASRVQVDPKVLAANALIERKGGRTIYRLRLPWSALGVLGGAYPAIGIDVQINNRDTGQSDKTPHHWGDGLRNGFTAAALQRFALDAPLGEFAAASWSDTLAWSPGSRSALAVGVRSDRDVPLALELGGETSVVRLAGGPGLRLYRIEIPARSDGSPLVATVAGRPPVRAVQTAATELYDRLRRRLAELEAPPDLHPMFRLHLQSLAALVSTEWGRMALQRNGDERRAVEGLGYFRDLLEGLNGEAGEWSAYRDGRRSLLIAYVSPHDQTVQYYFLGLPRDWDESRAYPLFFELHGAGNDHPLCGPARRLGVAAGTDDLRGHETPRVYAETDRAGFWVQPFGRGNLGYVGIARRDVLEAYDHAHRRLRIDPDRRYLYGFSMGGGGALALAQRTPSRWAAACSISGASGREPLREYLVANLAGLPFKLMCGEQDRLVEQHAVVRGALVAHGIPVEARVVEGIGHQYTAEMQRDAVEWLKAHRRRRPAEFEFATDDNLTNEAWGLRLHVAQGIPLRRGASGPFAALRVAGPDEPGFARARVRLEGGTVHIESEGARGISLDFSEPDGLGLTRDVRVIWNGREAYRGPAKPLNL